MSEQDRIEVEGTVIEVLPNVLFRLRLSNGHTLLAKLSGKMRINFEKLEPGSKVWVRLAPTDLSRGWILGTQASL